MTEFVITFCAVALFGCLLGMLIPEHRATRPVQVVLSLVLLFMIGRLAGGISAELPSASWNMSVSTDGWQDETSRAVASAVLAETDTILSARFQCRVRDADVRLSWDDGTVSVAEIRLYCSVTNDEILRYVQDYLGTDRVVLVPPS